MLKSIFICISFCFILTSSQKEKRETIIVHYSAISCPCAQWEIENSNPKEYIYLVRNNINVKDANKIWDGKTLPLKLRLVGKFKKEKGIPKEENLKGDPQPAKIFEYNKIEILQFKPNNK